MKFDIINDKMYFLSPVNEEWILVDLKDPANLQWIADTLTKGSEDR